MGSVRYLFFPKLRLGVPSPPFARSSDRQITLTCSSTPSNFSFGPQRLDSGTDVSMDVSCATKKAER